MKTATDSFMANSSEPFIFLVQESRTIRISYPLFFLCPIPVYI